MAIIVETILGKEAAEKVKKVPLSNDTISRRIEEMSSDLKDQIREHFEASSDGLWSLQIDESTDISGKAQLLAFIRFVKEEKFSNEFLFCKELQSTTRGEDIFALVKENISIFGMLWKNCISVCTDGCPSMFGKKKGFVTLVRQENDNIKSVHCMIHRESLASKSLLPALLTVMKQVINVVNFIKSRPLRSRIFAQLCEAMDSGYKTLLYHTEVRWLSKGKVLKRLVHLQVEVISFLEVEDTEFDFSIHDKFWWLQVQFLSDFFEKLNFLNTSLQGPSENIVTSTSKLKAFDEKLTLWRKKISIGNFDCFPGVNVTPSKENISSAIISTIDGLQKSLKNYFPSFSMEEYEWVVNPFVIPHTVNLTTVEEEQLIDLKNNKVHAATFPVQNLDEFWLSVRNLYPAISLKAVKILLPFSSSWLCEFGFSSLTEIKSKKRERLLKIDDEMRTCLSTSEPRFDLICSKKQAQPSH